MAISSNGKKNLRASIRALLWSGCSMAAVTLARAQQPLPCGTGSCSATGGPAVWVTSGAASATLGAHALTINQTTDKAILNWQTFDIGADDTVRFVQPDATSVALNRVWDPGLNPSRILGTLEANGQVYLINRNGILFGEGARINVGSLVASTLNITDATFNLGLLSAINQPALGDKPAFQGDGRAVVIGADGNPARFAAGADGKPARFRVDVQGVPVLDAQGNKIPDTQGRYIVDPDGATLPVEVTIAAGATLAADSGGRIMVFGQNVRNDGSIDTPDGQAILAAGNRVYLLQDNALRGLLVEVDTTTLDSAVLQSYLKGESDSLPSGNVTNTGTISAPRGNVTVMGLAVNQSGRVSATSALNANGSIRLLARSSGAGGPVITGTLGVVDKMIGTAAGRLTLGEGSSTRVDLDTNGAADTAVDEQVVLPSSVEAMGQQIDMRAGAQIFAPSGSVSLSAVVRPDEAPGLNTTQDPNAWVRVAADSRIDVSGTDVTLPMSRNQVDVELRGTELADSPLQRNGVLYGKTVTVDLRTLDADGKIPIADISGALANIKRTLAERSTPGGDVAISSVGSVDLAAGSSIDVSGGTAHYESGTLTPTLLMSDGRVFDIGTADPNRHYDAVLGSYTKNYAKWGIKQTWSTLAPVGQDVDAFDAGADAGSLQMQAYTINPGGTLRAASSRGPFQREPRQTPHGGELIIGDPTGGGLTNGRSYRAPDVTLLGAGSMPPERDGDNRLLLDVGELTGNGFDRIHVFSNGRITLAGAITLPGGGELSLHAAEVVVDGAISAPSGRISVGADVVDPSVRLTETNTSLLEITEGAILDVAGRWTNDTDTALLVNGAVALDPVRIDGGEISVSVRNRGDLIIGDNVRFDASAGAWLSAAGNLSGGRGGHIELAAAAASSSDPPPAVTLGRGLELEAYALHDGGRLDLSLPRVAIEAGEAHSALVWPASQSTAEPDSPDLRVPSWLFDNGGFSSVALDVSRGDLRFASVALQPVMENYLLEPGFEQRGSGGKLADIARIETLPAWMRAGVDVSLSVSDLSRAELPELSIDASSVISLDAGSHLTLSSTGVLNIDGVLNAPAGSISLGVSNAGSNIRIDYNPERVLRVGSGATISAAGVVVRSPDPVGLRRGVVLDAGSISLTGQGAYIDVQAGAVLDVSGASTVLDIDRSTTNGGQPIHEAQRVDGDAGSLNLTASEGIRLDGTIAGHGGGPASQGADLRVELNLNRLGGFQDIPKFLNEHGQPRQVVLTAEASSGSVGGKSIDGKAVISAPALAGSGVDSLTLRSQDEIAFSGAIDLVLGRSLRLDAPLLRHVGGNDRVSAALDAPYIGIGPGDVNRSTPLGSTVGDATLVLGASRSALVDLIGKTQIVGFTDTAIKSRGDIRLIGLQQEFNTSSTDPLLSGLSTFGDLALQAGQIYPTTMSRFGIESLDLPAGEAGPDPVYGTISVLPGNAPPSELTPAASVFGSVSLTASSIVQAGVVKAPLGHIELKATPRFVTPAGGTQQLVPGTGELLMSGTLSTAADADLTLFGQVVAGAVWDYTDATGNLIELYEQGLKQSQFSTEQQVSLTADRLSLAPGSVVDIDGGGDALGYEFQPGPGGSLDVLSADVAAEQGTYAILPWLRQGYAPYDAEIFRGWDLQRGQSVELLEGVGALAPGVYPLLPARYAVLPGAYVINSVANSQDLQPGVASSVVDGTRVLAGRLAVAGTSIHDSRTSGFAVRDAAYALARSEYKQYRFGDFLVKQAALDEVALPRLARDAGTLVLDASSAIAIDGDLSGRPGKDGRGSRVDVTADRIVVVPERTTGVDGVQLVASDLDSLDATSILIGGRRSNAGNSSAVDVRATDVTIASGTELRAPEILLAARGGTGAQGEPAGGVTVQSGAVVSAEGTFVGTPRDLVIGSATGAAGNGDGVLLRVSAAEQVALTRFGSTGTRGVLDIQAGATVAASRSMILDASARTSVSGAVDIGKGSLTLGAERISLGAVPEGTPGLSLLSDELARLAPAELVLSSRSTLDLYGDVSFGTDAAGNVLLDSLVVNAAGIAGYAGSGQSRLVARSVALSNVGNAASFTAPATTPPPAAGTGSLELVASASGAAASLDAADPGTLLLGEGSFHVAGFFDLAVRAERGVVGSGAGTLSAAANAKIEAPRISVAGGANTALEVGGRLDITAGVAPIAARDLPVAGLGGRLTITADALALASTIELPSGQVSLAARADLVLANDAAIDVSGRVRRLGETDVGSWGGNVALSSREGNVSLAAGSSIDLSGAASGGGSGGADAGGLSLSAFGLAGGSGGGVDVQGEIVARAQNGYRQGRFGVDAVRLADGEGFATLNTVLDAGAFDESRSFRLRQGDIVVSSGTEIAAHEIRLVADAGAVDVLGTLNADGVAGGAVTLAAGGDVTLREGSVVSARATSSSESGGSVSLSSTGGRLDLRAGSTIDLGGNGEVSLRARRARLAQATDAAGQPALDGAGRPVIAVDAGGLPIYLYTAVDGRVLAAGPAGGGALFDGAGRPVVDPGTDDTLAVTGLKGSISGARRVSLEAFSVSRDADGQLSAAEVASGTNNPLFAKASAFMTRAASILSSLGVAADPTYRLLPGIEIVADGNLTLASDWNLLSWRFGTPAVPGVLTLRAPGDLTLSRTLSDAFNATTTAGVLQAGDSWSYRLVGGADLFGADPMALRSQAAVGAAGNVVVASGQRVRTGNGDIAIAAARDFQLTDQTSTVYTAGVPTRATEQFTSGTTQFIKNWTTGGGDLSIVAQHDVLGAKTNQLVSSWLWRQGRDRLALIPVVATQWAVDFRRFEQNVGALGGGDVSIAAGHNVDNLSAVIPTTGRQATVGDDRSVIETWGGGDLSVSAGADILGGIFMVGNGQGRIEAGGSLLEGTAKTNGQPLAAILVAGDASFDVRTGGSSTIGTVAQQNFIPQPFALTDQSFRNFFSWFMNYGPDDALRVASAAGDVVLQSKASGTFPTFFPDLRAINGSRAQTLSVLPPTVQAYALSGSISVANEVNLLPAPSGTLDLRAARAVTLSNVTLSDADPRLLPTPKAPVDDPTLALTRLGTGHGDPVLHAEDLEPVRIVADTGNVRSDGILRFSKPVSIWAGNDVQTLKLSAQNLRDSDVSVVRAGRDIRFTSSDAVSTEKIDIAGPGRLDVLAGRNIDLGASVGITTVGNLNNTLLDDVGADVTVMAGTATLPGYQGFVDKYFAEQDDHAGDVSAYMRDLLHDPDLTDAAARAAFLALPAERQQPLVLQAFFGELRAAGREVNAGGDYHRGFDAIATLFPQPADGEAAPLARVAADGEPPRYAGDLSMYQSRIYTLDGGDINLLVPGGFVNEGLAGLSNSSKQPSDLGIVAQRSGSVRAFTDGDFIVNRSRVFTLGGGDIIMWSSKGNIDAGRGAKTAISAPAPTVTFDSAGNAVVDLSGAVAGSGIRAIITDENVKPGSVDLIAPVGFVNAGDAGIFSAGDLNIAAVAVIGADNIQVGGVATGVPVETGGLGASLSGVSSVAAGASNTAEESVTAGRDEESATPLADTALGFLDVFVTGFGDDNCAADDTECQQRQRRE